MTQYQQTKVTFPLFKSLKPYRHIYIIIELLPYWFTYKIYKRILNDEIEITSHPQ